MSPLVLSHRGIVAYPKPFKAILDVMAERPNHPMLPREVIEAVKQTGRFDPGLKSGVNAYQVALRRLFQDPASKLVVTDGRYYYADSSATGAHLTITVSASWRPAA